MKKVGLLKKGLTVTLASLTVMTGAMGVSGIALAETGGTVNVDGLNVRSGAGTNSQIIGVIGKGTQVAILETTGDWYKVNTVVNGSQTTGYVSAQYISAGAAYAASSGTVNVSGLNVRSSASTNAGIVSVLGKGTAVTINGTEGSWYKITAGNVSGYVFAEYITTTAGGAQQAPQQQAPQNTPTATSGTGTVNVGGLNLRKGASTNTGVVKVLAKGTTVTINGTEGSWYKVTVGNATGYVSAEYITVNGTAQAPQSTPTATSGTGTVNVSALNLRSSTSTSSSVVTLLSKGTTVNIVGKDGNWYKVNVGSASGYVYAEYITLGTDSQQAPSSNATPSEGTVNVSSLNVRTGAGTNNQSIGMIGQGTVVQILEKSGDWYKVNTTVNGAAKTGYVHSSYITVTKTAAPQQQAPAAAENNGNITPANETIWATETLNIRKEPSTSSAILGGLSKGGSITRTGIVGVGEWSRVSYNGETAYVYSRYITTTNPNNGSSQTKPNTTPTTPSTGSGAGVDVVNFALQFVGNPYVYGGNSLTNGVDCSGFTQQVYLHFGYKLNRSADAQRENGIPVSLDEIQPGDLLFYGSSSYASHVTIYMGGGQVVHASTPSTGIKISDMSYRTPFAARRIIY